MATTYIDFEIQENIFSTSEVKHIFDEKARIQRWLDIESCLANVQAKHGMIPEDAAKAIQSTANLEVLDMKAIKSAYQKGKNSIMPIIKALADACPDNFGEYVHYGLTTQDVVDTGQILEIKAVVDIIYRDARDIEQLLLDLVKTHQTTPMIGRTHGQHAMPITFGLKVSIWLSEIRRHIERIKRLHQNLLIGQLSGAVGTKAALGSKAEIICQETLENLGLNYDPLAWHVARDNIAEFACQVNLLVSTFGKIANEIFQLAKTDVGELIEGNENTTVMSSSAMPHKNNPVLSQRIVVLARQVRGLTNTVVDSIIHEGERDPRALWSEWLSMPQLLVYATAALHHTKVLLRRLYVNRERMLENLMRYGEYSASEYVMFNLAKHFGKLQAQQRVHQLIQQAREKSISFKQVLLEDAEIQGLVDENMLNMLDHPYQYHGETQATIDHVISMVESARQHDSLI